MRPSLAFSQVGRFPLSLDGNLYFPSGKDGLPKVEWLQMIELVSTKVISTSWLNTLSIASSWLLDQQMGLLRTAHHPNPAAGSSLAPKVLCKHQNTSEEFIQPGRESKGPQLVNGSRQYVGTLNYCSKLESKFLPFPYSERSWQPKQG